MVSFAATDQLKLAAEVCQSIALDNGAFSTWKRGADYDIDGFLDWSTLWLKHPSTDWAIAPDVIDGTEAENDSLLELVSDRKDEYVPVWHLHESLDRLERLVNEWPRVCLGSSGKYATPGKADWWGVIDKAMEVACDSEGYPKAKLHGLRMLNATIFSRIPLSSADSTNVARRIGVDQEWKGTLLPRTAAVRAEIMMERIELHANCKRWEPLAEYRNNKWLLG